jgi:hypothetical protein
MSEDLIIGPGSEEEKEEEIIEEEEDGNVFFTTNAEYIASAVNSLSAMYELDYDMVNAMSKEDGKRVKRIIRKSLRIIDFCITEMYDELFEEDEND